MCGGICTYNISAHGHQKKAADSLELKLQGTAKH